MLAHSEKRPHRAALRPLFISSATQSPATVFPTYSHHSLFRSLVACRNTASRLKACFIQPYTAKVGLPLSPHLFPLHLSLSGHTTPFRYYISRLHEGISERPTSPALDPAPPHSPDLLSVSPVLRDSYQSPLNKSNVIRAIHRFRASEAGDVVRVLFSSFC